MKLVLIEGPGKRESVQHYLGNDYKVMPTFVLIVNALKGVNRPFRINGVPFLFRRLLSSGKDELAVFLF